MLQSVFSAVVSKRIGQFKCDRSDDVDVNLHRRLVEVKDRGDIIVTLPAAEPAAERAAQLAAEPAAQPTDHDESNSSV